MKEAQQKISTIWFHFYKFLENANLSMGTESRPMVSWELGGGVEKRGRDSKEILRSNDYVHYLGFDDSFMSVYTGQNLPKCTF